MTPVRVTELLRAQFPELPFQDVTCLGEGYDCVAFDVDDAWVVRLPKRTEVERQLLLEAAVLPHLSSSAPLPIPNVTLRGTPCDLFTRHFVGYPKLAGEPAINVQLDRSLTRRWARELGSFLSWLHAYPIDQAESLGVQRLDTVTILTEAIRDARTELQQLKGVVPRSDLRRWQEFLVEAEAMRPKAPQVLVHGDFAAEHVLHKPDSLELTGVIDWSQMALCDPAVDIAGLYHWGGERVVEAVLQHYTGVVDGTTLLTARILAACRGVADIKFGIDTGRSAYIRAGLRALNQCRVS